MKEGLASAQITSEFPQLQITHLQVQSAAMPSATYRHSAVTPASQGQGWAKLQDPAMWATVADVDSTSDHRHDGGMLAGFRFTTSIAGVNYRGTAIVTDATPTTGMTLAIKSNELVGTIRVGLAPTDGGTSVEVEMRMEPTGLMGTMIFPIVTSAVSSGFDGSVERFAACMGVS